MNILAKLTTALLLLSALPSFSQKIKITGKVTDASTNEIMQGVSVRAKSSGAGTSTNAQGVYSIDAASNDVLEFTYTGYAPEAVSVKGKSTINVSMKTAVTDLNQVVVVGSRSGGRIRTETPVPVDVISVNNATQVSAKTDLTSLLNVLAPSFNYNKQSGSDGADAIDLATLRGLGPDQTLVLINGKRRHQTAFVALFGTRGRGNSGTDLNAIPEAAIDRVEILRDGASAQYGSDAIAGVINIILKKDVKHLNVSAGWAGYDDHKYNSLNVITPNEYVTGHQIDGGAFKLGLDYGIPIGKNNGYLDLGANFLTQGKTFRQVPDTNVTTNDKALPVNTGRRANGDASVQSGGLLLNAEIPIAHTKTTAYFFGGYNYKESNAYAYSRNFSARPDRFPTDANGNLAFVPDIMHKVNPGDPNSEIFFNPLIDVHITDASFSGGVKGILGKGWDWDLSNTIGENDFHYYGQKTFNASLNAEGKNRNRFNDGGFSFLQNTFNIDISKHFPSILNGFTFSFGGEYRYEQYKIYAGEEASYKNFDPDKTVINADGDEFTVAAGSQGFPGFQPGDEVKAHRNNLGLYVDGELDVTNKWLVGGAIRYENYSDFGSLATFKFDTRYKVASNFNLRGSVSTGYRAPSLQQINFSNTFTNVQGGKIFEVKIAPNYSPITKAAGIPNLNQEKSLNASLGFSWKPAKNFTITVDGYLVKIKDRVVLTGQFDTSVAAIAPILEELNVAQAQFYANAVNTTNYGLDVVVNYDKTFKKNSLKIVLAGNFQHMTIDNINIPTALNDTYEHQQAFFSDREQKYVLASAPPVKLGFNLEYGNRFRVGTYQTYFGKVEILGYGYENTYPPLVALDKTGELVPEQFNYNGKLVSDLYVTYKFTKVISGSLGCDNIFNVHPDLGIVKGANMSAYDGEAGGPWDPVQMGFNGRRLYAKMYFKF
ncbi:TonB-dependent receptor [Pinibacter soli]|uniref:TonB-dependent receptor n=1 Tax=Pinibacter soli TaxID=3044211 RepID=A0ABT6RJ34_9BACT|nr:TonB-dependent receptor [Pinibacter soli]MDI3322585.1 TonB-dependent receptor [Pinibacter soli]